MGIDLDIRNADDAPPPTQNNKPPPKQNGASGDSKHDLPKKAKTEPMETSGQSEVLFTTYWTFQGTYETFEAPKAIDSFHDTAVW